MSVGGGCVGVPELLQGGGCQLGLAPKALIMEETWVRVGVEGDVPGQYGPHLPRNENHLWRLHLRVRRLQHRCYGRAEPAPQRGHIILSAGTAFCGGGRPEVWAQ